METFNFYSPTYFVFGKGTEYETGKYVKQYGGHNVPLHYDGGSVVKSGLLEAVMLTMIKGGKRVMQNPNDYEARAAPRTGAPTTWTTSRASTTAAPTAQALCKQVADIGSESRDEHKQQ